MLAHLAMPCSSILEPDSGINMRATVETVLARLGKLHMHLWGKDQIEYKPETACSTLDLALFIALNLNKRPDKILLVRSEYILAYRDIVKDTLKKPTTQSRRSATLVTGQPGIGASSLKCMTQEISAYLTQ